MNPAKCLGFSVVGALAAAVLWIILVKVTGMNLWLLAPVVGGAAGYGMMRATKMRGGMPAGVGAAAVTLVAIFGARYFIVSQDVQQMFTISEEDAYAAFTDYVAEDMARQGHEVHDGDGDYVHRVQQTAYDNWMGMSDDERLRYMASVQQESNAAAGSFTPIGLLFDFGIFGTICTVLSMGTALKTGSVKLEDVLAEKGLAGSGDASALAAHLRAGGTVENAPPRTVRTEEAGERASSGGIWAIPMRAAEERPLPKIKVVSSDEGESKAA